ncbi:MAG TPA: IPT/TIG domain-containing protein [Kofleriaceae bacterium]|jgi:hypothetical protein
MTRLAFIALLAAACGQVSVTPPDAAPDAAPAALTAIAPASGIVTTMVTVTGDHLGATKGSVTFDGFAGTIVSWADTTIVVAVPDIKPQMADVVVTTASGLALTGQQFQVVLPPRAYTHNQANDPMTTLDTISVLTFDPTAKTLTQLGTNVTTGMPQPFFGGCSHSLVINEATRRLFVGGQNGVGVFDIDPVTGALSPVPGSPFTVSMLPVGTLWAVEVNDDGTKLWAAGGLLYQFDVAADGSLTPVTGSPFADVGSTAADVIVLSNTGQFLYANSETNQFSAFSTAAMTALTGAPYSQGFFTFYIARRPTTEQLYLTGLGKVSVWQPDAATGVPTQITGSPFAIGLSEANGMTFTPDGNHAYVIDQGSSNRLAELSIDATGKPTPLTGSPNAIVTPPATINGACTAMSSDGTVLAVAGESPSVALMSIGADGTATPITGSPFTYMAAAATSGFAITF